MKRLIFCIASLAAIGISYAQEASVKYAQTISAENLKKHLSIIAGPEMEGRETGTEGQRKAAAYISEQFRKAGLKAAPGTNNYLQEYPLFYDTIIKSELKLNGQKLQFGIDFYTPALITNNQFLKEKKIVFVGYGISDSAYDDYAGKNVKGKIVLMFGGEPKQDSLFVVNGSKRASKWSFPGQSAKAATAMQKGAALVLYVLPAQPGFRPENILRKSNIYYPPADANINQANIITVSHHFAATLFGKEAFDQLLNGATTNKPLNKFEIKLKRKIVFDYVEKQVNNPGSNVVGFIEGTDKKDEFVILTAHYDHLGKKGDVIFNGADDDGSGTVSVIQMAEAFAMAKAAGHTPRRSVIFMTVSGEEKGLLGSRYYSDHPLFPLEKTSVDLNTDMVGRIDPTRKEGDSTNYVYIIGEDRISSELMSISEKANKNVGLELDRKFNANDPNRFYFRSDHYNFAKKGVPIIFYFNGTHADYHKASDTIDKINFDLMAKRVKLIFLTAWEMANRDEMLKRDIPLK